MYNESSLESEALDEPLNGAETCQYATQIFKFYIYPILNFAGLVFNATSIVIYMRLMRVRQARGNMHKFLLAESICEAYYCLRNLAYIAYNYNPSMQRILLLAYVNWLCIVYAGDVALWMAMLCRIGASFSRLRKVCITSEMTDDKTWCLCWRTTPPRLSRFCSNFKLMLIAMFAFSSLAYSHRIFEITLRAIPEFTATTVAVHFNLSTSSQHSIYVLWYERYNVIYYMDIVNSAFVKFVFVVLILVLNVLTLIKTRKFLNHKRQLTRTSITQRNSSNKRFLFINTHCTFIFLLFKTIYE